MAKDYVLLTAAKNESDFIEATIKSVIFQELKPKKWLILLDSCTDGTEEIVRKYSEIYLFINIIKIINDHERNFASKVNAINSAYNSLVNLEFEFIGILDADITFSKNYYKEIIKQFDENPKLGIAGGGFYDVYGGKLHKIPYSAYSVRGAVQFFKRKCYEDIGGLMPLKWGGEDSIACAAARMHGWETNTFENLIVYHNRKTGSAGLNIFRISLESGKRDYNRGLNSFLHFIKSLSRIYKYPFFIGTLLQLSGFWWLKLKREKLLFSKELHNFIKLEYKLRIMKFFHIYH